MTKTEEALINGIIFSVPRMIPTAIQEGELDNALYFVIVYLTPQLDKIVLKLYSAPSYEPLKWDDENIESVTFDMEKLTNTDEDDTFAGYNFGDSRDGDGRIHPSGGWLRANEDKMYNGLSLYSGLKCLIISTINKIINQGK